MYKSLLPIIDLDIIVLIILTIVLFMYKSRFNMKEKVNKTYFNIVSTTIIVIVLEILDKIILLHTNNALIPISKIINVFGFGLCPVVPFLWMKYLFENFNININSKLLMLPIAVNFFVCVLSYEYGFVFSIGEFNSYSRGPLFLVPMVMTIIYFFSGLILVYLNREKFNKTKFLILALFAVLPMIAAIVQMFFNNVLLIWGSVGIAIITHYIYLQETLLKFDSLTGVWNRMTFESYFNNKYLNKNNDFLLIYADANDFKSINDNFGHNEGDIALINISKVLSHCFNDIGKIARLGGDEFIVVADTSDDDKINAKINKIYTELDKINKKSNKGYELKLSLGYKKFSCIYLKLSDYIEEIDELMYLDKKRNKRKHVK